MKYKKWHIRGYISKIDFLYEYEKSFKELYEMEMECTEEDFVNNKTRFKNFNKRQYIVNSLNAIMKDYEI